MKKYIVKIVNVTLVFFVIIAFNACAATQNANNKQKGTVIGAAGGAILGAIIGNNTGKKGSGGGLGAVIGGVVGGAAGILIGNKMDKQAQKIEEEIPGAIVERIDDGIVVTFDQNSGVHFDTNKYAINADSKALLDKLGSVLIEYPDTHVAVVGHTDSAGAAQYNMMLSKNRALAVTNVFAQMGIAENRFTTNWFGEDQPIADNTTPEGKAKNRRVNLAILPNEKMIEDAKKEAGQK
jgi:outer membrane protein OmpA-like peptidoglycan-associated protein|tara:strand:+ start:3262 stop:3972 length:711 start_codon:yes stop_codon:yes gene_type:complete